MSQGQTIQVEIQNGEDYMGFKRFDPAATIQARVTIMPGKDVKGKVEAWLEWHTEGKGEKNNGKTAPTVVYEGDLLVGTPYYEDVTLDLPLEPWSYVGQFIDIKWALRVKINVALGEDFNSAAPFIMRPLEGLSTNITNKLNAEDFLREMIEEKIHPLLGALGTKA